MKEYLIIKGMKFIKGKLIKVTLIDDPEYKPQRKSDHKILKDVDSDGTGTVTLDIVPKIVTAPADNATVGGGAEIGDRRATLHVSHIRLGRDSRQVPRDPYRVHLDAGAYSPFPSPAVEIRGSGVGSGRRGVSWPSAFRDGVYCDGIVFLITD